jgi:4'-phosphopantetheinyl transferase EntD
VTDTLPHPARTAPEIAALLPPGAEAAVLVGPGRDADLLAEERVAIRRAAPARRREFAAGRDCARHALAALGIGALPVPQAPDRAPCWPDGVVGSITHTGDFAAAAVAHRRDLAGLGIDAERRDRAVPRLWSRICTPAELAWLESLPEGDRVALATALFSAKEAFYKCQHPLTDTFLAYRDVEIRIAESAFTLEVLRDVPALEPYLDGPAAGRILHGDDVVVTAIALAARESS